MLVTMMLNIILIKKIVSKGGYQLIAAKKVKIDHDEHKWNDQGGIAGKYRDVLLKCAVKTLGQNIDESNEISISDFCKLKLKIEGEFATFHIALAEAIESSFEHGKGCNFGRIMGELFMTRDSKKYMTTTQENSIYFGFKLKRCRLKNAKGNIPSKSSDSPARATVDDLPKLAGNEWHASTDKMKADFTVRHHRAASPILIGEVKYNTKFDDYLESVAQSMSFALAARNESPSKEPLYVMIINPSRWYIGDLLCDVEGKNDFNFKSFCIFTEKRTLLRWNTFFCFFSYLEKLLEQ